MDILNKLNLFTHEYDESKAKEAVLLIRKKYKPALNELINFFKLRTNECCLEINKGSDVDLALKGRINEVLRENLFLQIGYIFFNICYISSRKFFIEGRRLWIKKL